MGGINKVQDCDASSKCIDSPQPKKRLYQVWHGRNKFLFGGRLIFGPDADSLFLTAFMIGTPALVFCVKMHLKLLDVNTHLTRLVFAFGLILTFLVLTFLFMTSSRNPGIVPRNLRPPESDTMSNSSLSMEWIAGATPDLKLPRIKDVFVNGHTIKVKYCDTCLLYRPPRASHCSICNNCVQRFDHHCPWVGQCIGVQNYRSFIMFISTSTTLCIYVFTFSLSHLLEQPGSVWSSLSDDLVSVALVVYCFIAIWFVGGLTVFHFYLISTNQTTYENFRYRYDKKENPFNQGMMMNIKEVLLSKTIPSMINFREWVSEEDETAVESITKRYCGEILKSRDKMDLEVGILEKNGKPAPDIMRNLDYRGIEDSLKKDRGGKMAQEGHFLFEKDGSRNGYNDEDENGTENSSHRSSTAGVRI